MVSTENSRRVVHAETISQHRATRFPVHQPELTFRISFSNLGWSPIKFPAPRGDIGGRAPDRRLTAINRLLFHSLTGTDVPKSQRTI
jgi:hypothetical protein